MDNSNLPNTPNPSLRPMNEPHTPISEAEQNHQMHHESPKSGLSKLLTMLSLLILAGVVSATLYLYIQNRNAQNTQQAINTPAEGDQQNLENEPVKEIAGTKVIGTENIEKMEKYGAICKRFTSLEEALAEKEVACGLDLSGQGLSEIPKEVYELPNLQEIDLSHNELSELPQDLIEIRSIISINVANNNINSVEGLNYKDVLGENEEANTIIHPVLQRIVLTDNPLTEDDIIQLREHFIESTNSKLINFDEIVIF